MTKNDLSVAWTAARTAWFRAEDAASAAAGWLAERDLVLPAVIALVAVAFVAGRS